MNYKFDQVTDCPCRRELKIMAGPVQGVKQSVCLNSNHPDFLPKKSFPVCEAFGDRGFPTFPDCCPLKKLGV